MAEEGREIQGSKREENMIKLIRLYEKYDLDVWGSLRMEYFNICIESLILNEKDIKDLWNSVVYPLLKKGRRLAKFEVDFSIDIYEDKDVIEKYYKIWIDWANLSNCHLLKPLTAIGDPTQTIKVGREKSLIHLNQILPRLEEKSKEPWGNKYQVHILCNNIRCISCGIKVTRIDKKDRDYCKAFQIIDGDLIWSCLHDPKCRTFGCKYIEMNLK